MAELFSMGAAPVVQFPTVGEWLMRISHLSYKRFERRVPRIIADVSGNIIANPDYNADLAAFDSRLNKGFRQVNVALPEVQGGVGLLHALGDITDAERAALLTPGLLPGETGKDA